jgi:iron(II)-dependent oxidoreductase
MTAQREAHELAQRMSETREETLRIFDLARTPEALRESPGGGFRPILWHLAHIGVFEGYWLLQKLRGAQPLDEHYERIFDPIRTPREESKNLPTRHEMEDYLTRVRAAALEALEGLGQTSFDSSDANSLARDGYVFRLVLEHEEQHQETLLYLLHLLDPALKLKADASASLPETEPPANLVSDRMATVPEGVCQIGSTWNAFAYDNELPAHEVFVPEFKIDRLLVTNEEYARFVEEGGYGRREFWSDEGWTWREREGWESPLYWRRAEQQQGGAWSVRGMFDEGALEPRHPVTGISWFEAEAYARFVGKRLPTEVEWEKAASWDERENRKRRFSWGDAEPAPSLCNFGRRFWSTTPVGSFPAGASPYGCLDMSGNVWEWTSDAFKGFEGFEAYPYPEYSEVWFDGDHRVLKGGSWATGASVLRTSFRNFFRRQFRIGFNGLRCASDA